MDIENQIQDVIKENCYLLTENEEGNQRKIHDYFDSVEFINLLVQLEEEFDMVFEDEYLTIDKFVYIEDIINYVKKRVSQNKSNER